MMYLFLVFFQLGQALGDVFANVPQCVRTHLRVQAHVRVGLHTLGRQPEVNILNMTNELIFDAIGKGFFGGKFFVFFLPHWD